MILAASCEFDKRHNSEIVERITDNEEVPMVWLLLFLIVFIIKQQLRDVVYTLLPLTLL